MAVRPARPFRFPPSRGSAARLPLLASAIVGLMAASVTRPAAAEPDASEAPERTEAAGPRASAMPQLKLDEYPAPAARRNLVIAGAVTTATWYGLALGSSYLWPDTVGAKDLRIPVAGPWIAFSHSGCGNVSDCSKVLVVVRAIATLIDGIGQASGLAFATEGLFMPTQEHPLTRGERATLAPNHFELRPTFDAGKNTVGFGVLGVF
ncbi:MAG: hypothetical protein ABI548_03000 [Polyangiaceae bacterium]